MFPAWRRARAQTHGGLRHTVKEVSARAIRSHSRASNADDTSGVESGRVQEPLQEEDHKSDMILAMQRQLDLQEEYMQRQLEMQQQILEFQRLQLAFLESQRAKPATFEADNTSSKVASAEVQSLPLPPEPLTIHNCPSQDAQRGEHTGSTYLHDDQDDACESDVVEDEALEVWRACSGLHTVDKWVLNYRKHPAGWAALLMIHGIPEVTSRLRSKVENYAIYSALFLSVSLPASFEMPTGLCAQASQMDLECIIRKRAYAYSILAGIVSNTFSIMLAMSFVNALNEAARDSDVFRMFARGKGFVATRKCQFAFNMGLVFNLTAMLVCVQNWVGWDAIAVVFSVAAVAAKIYWGTAELLFANASIVHYWREELGGKPDPDDPYDLDIPVQLFKERADLAHWWKSYPKERLSTIGDADKKHSVPDVMSL